MLKQAKRLNTLHHHHGRPHSINKLLIENSEYTTSSTRRHFHIRTIQLNNNNDKNFRESSTLLAKALLSRHQYYQQQQQQQSYTNNNYTTSNNNSQTSQILIATSPHEQKIYILFVLGGIICVLTGVVVYHIYTTNSIRVGTNITNVPTVEEVSFNFENLKKELAKQNDLSTNTIVSMQSLPENQKLPFTALLVALNVVFLGLTLLVKNRMVGKLYINNPNQYIKYKKVQVNNQLLLNNLKNNTTNNNNTLDMNIVNDSNNNNTLNSGNNSIPLSVLIQKQEYQLLDDLSFTLKTNDRLVDGKEIEFKAKDITKIGIDNTITHISVNDKRYFLYGDHADSAEELYQFLKQITKHNRIQVE